MLPALMSVGVHTGTSAVGLVLIVTLPVLSPATHNDSDGHEIEVKLTNGN